MSHNSRSLRAMEPSESHETEPNSRGRSAVATRARAPRRRRPRESARRFPFKGTPNPDGVPMNKDSNPKRSPFDRKEGSQRFERGQSSFRSGRVALSSFFSKGKWGTHLGTSRTPRRFPRANTNTTTTRCGVDPHVEQPMHAMHGDDVVGLARDELQCAARDVRETCHERARAPGNGFRRLVVRPVSSRQYVPAKPTSMSKPKTHKRSLSCTYPCKIPLAKSRGIPCSEIHGSST